MVAYSFRRRFIEPIRAGTKRQTIRAERKRHARPGEELQLYTGMRTQHCDLIGRARCLRVDPMRLHLSGGWVWGPTGVLDTSEQLTHFAIGDGFESWPELVQFWVDNHPGIDPFSGVLIIWGRLTHGEAS